MPVVVGLQTVGYRIGNIGVGSLGSLLCEVTPTKAITNAVVKIWEPE
jgi:hypothetical protein